MGAPPPSIGAGFGGRITAAEVEKGRAVADVLYAALLVAAFLILTHALRGMEKL